MSPKRGIEGKVNSSNTRTVLSKALKKRTENHDAGAEHDRPPSSVTVRKPWGNRDSEDGSELVARVHEAEKTGLDSIGALGILAAVTEV